MTETDPQRRREDRSNESPLTTLPLTEREYAALKAFISPEVIIIGRSQQPEPDFVFNVSLAGEIFRYTKTGRTRPADRTDLRRELPILDTIARAAVAARGETGRFFGNRTGIHYKSREKKSVQCLKFQITGSTS